MPPDLSPGADLISDKSRWPSRAILLGTGCGAARASLISGPFPRHWPRRVRTIALAPSELVWVADTARARAIWGSSPRLYCRLMWKR
jgi:hypothetical protein